MALTFFLPNLLLLWVALPGICMLKPQIQTRPFSWIAYNDLPRSHGILFPRGRTEPANHSIDRSAVVRILRQSGESRRMAGVQIEMKKALEKLLGRSFWYPACHIECR